MTRPCMTGEKDIFRMDLTRIIAFCSGANDSLLNEITIEVDRPVHWKVGQTFPFLAPLGAQGVRIFVHLSY